MSPAGVKRIGYAVTDVIWATVHLNPTNTQDMDKLEADVISVSFESYDKFKKAQSRKVVTLWNKIIKKLIL